MKKKNDYVAMAKATNSENVNGVGAKDAPIGMLKFKAMGKPTSIQGSDAKWIPVYLESEDGTLIRLSAKSIIQAKGLKFHSALGADRLASVDQACENGLEVSFNGSEERTITCQYPKNDKRYYEPYKRYILEFESTVMPEPEYAEGE